MSFEFNKSPQSVFRPVFAPSDERGRDRPRLPDETRLDALGFTKGALEDLQALDITTLGQLRTSSEEYLEENGLNRRVIRDIKRVLKEYDESLLSFKKGRQKE